MPVCRKISRFGTRAKAAELRKNSEVYAKCGADPMALVLALRRAACAEALVFVDVSAAEHWAAEAFQTCLPRTYFNPTDNQAMGWSIPAALGAQRVNPGRTVATITGDGCLPVRCHCSTRACVHTSGFGRFAGGNSTHFAAFTTINPSGIAAGTKVVTPLVGATNLTVP